MLETLIGGVLGGVFRLAPEVLKALDRGAERAHELSMQDKALEFEKLRGAQRMSELGAQADAAFTEGAMSALAAAVEAQGRPSGVRWVDGLSTSVRPVITYAFMLMYAATKCALFIASADAGGVLHAFTAAWSADDQALWAGVLNYWFLSRVLERRAS